MQFKLCIFHRETLYSLSRTTCFSVHIEDSTLVQLPVSHRFPWRAFLDRSATICRHFPYAPILKAYDGDNTLLFNFETISSNHSAQMNSFAWYLSRCFIGKASARALPTASKKRTTNSALHLRNAARHRNSSAFAKGVERVNNACAWQVTRCCSDLCTPLDYLRQSIQRLPFGESRIQCLSDH